jgi:asparagine synthase (glutamine-hydrolysing)
MCGILGSINQPFDENTLNLISHRGPDDSGMVQIDYGDNSIYLGHRRLAIQDISAAGHQPMYSACRKFIMVFNGEIYNHYELRDKLTGIKFKGHSDTETIVNYIAHFGIDAVKDFNGIFAFALLDIENNQLYLARDRYGVKPLYFFKDTDRFIFSSEIRPLQVLSETHVDVDNLALLLKLRFNPSPTTLYEAIHKLLPGHVLTIDLVTKSHTLCSFIQPIAINNDISFADALETYEKLFEQAIKRQLLADVEVGVLLSGGIDSALVAYYAQKYSDKPIKTFTIGFNDHDDSDETLNAQETADLLGTEHYSIKISDNEFEHIFSECINIVEEPLGTTSIIPMYYLNQLAAKHVKVVLTGQGADEPLGGYKRYQGEIIHEKFPAFIFKLLKPLSKFIKNEQQHRALNALGEKDIIKRFDLIYALFKDEEIHALIGRITDKSQHCIKYFYDLLEGNKKKGVEAMMANDLRMNLPDDLLLYTDKISMHFSIEARVPILDNDLIDFIESLPYRYRINGKEGKYIHKKFAEKILPSQIIYRMKKGFQSPTEKWFKGEKGTSYKKLLLNTESKFAHYFDLDAVAKFFDSHITGTRNLEKQLFTLISLYYWLEKSG